MEGGGGGRWWREEVEGGGGRWWRVEMEGGRRWREEVEGGGGEREWRVEVEGGGEGWRWRKGWRERVEGRGGRRRCPNDLEALSCSVCPNTKVLDVSNLEKVPFVVQNEERVHETHPSSSLCLENIDVIHIKPLPKQ